MIFVSPSSPPEDGRAQTRGTHSSRGGLFVAGFASDLEGDAIGSRVLEFKSSGRQVVEVLVEQLEECNTTFVSRLFLFQYKKQ